MLYMIFALGLHGREISAHSSFVVISALLHKFIIDFRCSKYVRVA